MNQDEIIVPNQYKNIVIKKIFERNINIPVYLMIFVVICIITTAELYSYNKINYVEYVFNVSFLGASVIMTNCILESYKNISKNVSDIISNNYVKLRQNEINLIRENEPYIV